MDTQLLKGIGLGMFYGAQAGVIGYLASEELPLSWKVLLTRKFWETFSWTKFSKTVLLGAVVGGITTAYFNVTPDMWTRFTDYTTIPQIPLSLILNFANTAVIMGIDRLAKFIVRRTPLVRVWNNIKDRILRILLAEDKYQ